ncbi:hypothetical protein SNEBB_009350, partial [Seison nebaliae]
KWVMESSENFDEFLKALGVGFLLRKAANAATPTVSFRHEGQNTYVMETVTPFKTQVVRFVLDKPFNETRMDGTKCSTTYSIKNGALVQVQKSEKDDVVLERTIDNGKFKLVCKTNNVVANRVYTRVKE